MAPYPSSWGTEARKVLKEGLLDWTGCQEDSSGCSWKEAWRQVGHSKERDQVFPKQ